METERIQDETRYEMDLKPCNRCGGEGLVELSCGDWAASMTVTCQKCRWSMTILGHVNTAKSLAQSIERIWNLPRETSEGPNVKRP